MEADIKISDSPEPLLQTSTSRPRMIKEIKHSKNTNYTLKNKLT